MKILILSSTPWNTDNSFGNSYSSIFEGIKNIEFANIYCSFGEPKNNISSIYFQIDEKSLFRSLLSPRFKTGRIIEKKSEPSCLTNKEMKRLSEIKRRRWRVFFWAQRFLWRFGKWKSKELNHFIQGFSPDLIFIPLYHSTFLNRIAIYIQKLAGVKMVGYVSDDIYTLRRISFSPFYWIDRIRTRQMVKKTVDKCEYLYVISEIQKKDYEKAFKKECKVLTKGSNFNSLSLKTTNSINKPIKLVYTGNIGSGRWRSLACLAEAIKIVNNEKIQAQLFVYSTTPLTKKMETSLNIPDCSFFMGNVLSDEVFKIQREASILIHVESFSLRDRLEVRHSFSTKIVDYFSIPRCIFAIGKPDVASIYYLISNDAALVATNKTEILKQLQRIVQCDSIITDYAKKAWECGKKNHLIDEIQKRLVKDLENLVNEKAYWHSGMKDKKSSNPC